MKAVYRILLICLASAVSTQLMAQETSQVQGNPSSRSGEIKNAGFTPSVDPKFTAGRQEQPIAPDQVTVQRTPAQYESDPKIPGVNRDFPQDQVTVPIKAGPAEDVQEAVHERDRKYESDIKQLQQQPVISPVSDSQPPGQVLEKTTNYREIKGPKDQPAGKSPGTTTDYRSMKGPKTQPQGEDPKR